MRFWGIVLGFSLLSTVWAGLLDGISQQQLVTRDCSVDIERNASGSGVRISGISPKQTSGKNYYISLSVRLSHPIDMRGKALCFKFQAVKPGRFGGLGIQLRSVGEKKPVWSLSLWDKELFSGTSQSLDAVGGSHRRFRWGSGDPEKATTVNRIDFYLGSPQALDAGEFFLSGLEVVDEKNLPEYVPEVLVLEVEKGELSPDMVIVEDKGFSEGKAVRLKTPVQGWPEPVEMASVTFVLPKLQGRYQVELAVRGTPELATVLKDKSYNTTVEFRLATDVWKGRRFSAFKPSDDLGRNVVTRTSGIQIDGASRLSLFLPPGLIVDRLTLCRVKPPEVPEVAKRYIPPVIPKGRPRVFINKELLPAVRAGLDAPENSTAWSIVQERAEESLSLPERVVPDVNVNSQLQAKAFLWLMSGKEHYAREAVAGLNHYFNGLEFGNRPDVTRNIGGVLRTCAMVYDWCYDFFTPEERKVLLDKAIELNSEMEIGYPPFKQNVINGHGNEGQFVVDTVAFSIAFYDENPDLYRYVTYRIMNEIVPAHTFEFAGGWHNQGTSYGQVRWSDEMQMVMMLERIGWKNIYPDSLKRLARNWLYARMPNSQLWEEGDFPKPPPKARYTCFPSAYFFATVWSRDPLLKGELMRCGVLKYSKWMRGSTVTALCFNDPTIPEDPNVEVLPQGLITGPTYPIMIQRTGWDMTEDSHDLFTVFTGAGFQSGNHQHLDAGHFEIFYREPLIVDLGVYRLYATPYDFNVNKRAVAHNILTVYDPAEKFVGRVNDGGQQYTEKFPPGVSPRSLQEIQEFTRNGKTLATYSGADELKPEVGFLKTDLKAAYHDKVQRYCRSSVFVRPGNPLQPGAVVIYDRVEKREPNLSSAIQLNTLASAKFDGQNCLLVDGEKAKLRCDMLLPVANNLCFEQKQGAEAMKIGTKQFKLDGSGYPQEHGIRNIFSTKEPSREDEYLAVLLPADKSEEVGAPVFRTRDTHLEIEVCGRELVLDRGYSLNRDDIEIEVSPEVDGVLLAGFEHGRWSCGDCEFEIKKSENAKYLKLPAGRNMLRRL